MYTTYWLKGRFLMAK